MRRLRSFWLAFVYLIVSILWISFSDQLLLALVDDPAKLTYYQSLKGWSFVFLSALLIVGLRMFELRNQTFWEDQVNEQARSMQSMVENIPGVVYRAKANPSRTIEYLSPSGSQLLGILVNDGRPVVPFDLVELIEPTDQVRVHTQLNQAIQNQKAYEISYQLKGPDQQTYWVLDSGRLRKRRNKDEYILEGVLSNITELQVAQRSLTEKIEELRSLRTIDQAILSSMEIPEIMDVVIQQIRNTLFAKAIHIDLVPAGVGGTQSYNFDPEKLLPQRDKKADNLNGHAGEIKIQPYMDRFAMASVSLVGRQQHLGQLLVVGQEHAVREDSWRSHFETVAGQLTIALEHVMILDRFKQTNDQLVQAQNNLLAGWARALEYKDRETQGHSDRVTDLTRKLGEKLEISAGDIDIMVQGAVLHDIGKMAIPDSILHKNGPLSPQEWAVMKQHPLYAQEFLKEVNFLEDAMIIPLYHHERWDGSGYPFGMAGKNIPLAARIFAIIDRWDALTHDRPYRKAWTADVTITHLRSIAGTEIDPELVELFIQVVNQE